MPNSSSILGSLLHAMKLCKNLKSAFLSWSVSIPNAVIGDPSTVFSCIDVAQIDILNCYLWSGM